MAKKVIWVIAFSLSAIGALIVMASLGVSAQLLSWSISVAAFGESVIAKYQILLAWTLGATALAFLTRLVVLYRRRAEHRLRWTEYFGHGLSSGVVSGGLAYGTVAVVIATMKGLATDIEAVGEMDRETLSNVTLMAIFPIFIVMMAAFMTALKNVVEIPKSEPPDPTIARMLMPLRFMIKHAKPSARFIKEVWSWMLAHLLKVKEVLEPRLKPLLSDHQSDASGHTSSESNPASAESSHQEPAHTSHTHQQQRALELIDRIDRNINPVDRHGGYDLAKPGSTRIGYVRFNIGGRDAGNYRVYTYEPFSDPRGRFRNDSGGGQGRRGWTCLVGPNNEEDIRYVVNVLESSYDQK